MGETGLFLKSPNFLDSSSDKTNMHVNLDSDLQK